MCFQFLVLIFSGILYLLHPFAERWLIDNNLLCRKWWRGVSQQQTRQSSWNVFGPHGKHPTFCVLLPRLALVASCSAMTPVHPDICICFSFTVCLSHFSWSLEEGELASLLHVFFHMVNFPDDRIINNQV